ncbi:MAG TPA: response regulator [Paucimonas sp.]|nr:response regulator [Paucimonas sp.]
MYESYLKVLAQICTDIFQSMTDTEVVATGVKPDQRADAYYPIAFNIKYEHLEKKVEGHFTLGFTEKDMAVAVAATLAKKFGLPPPEELDMTAMDLLNEFLNTVVGRAIAEWDKLGFKVRFFPPTSCINAPLRPPTEIDSKAFIILLKLKVHYVTFRVAFIDDAMIGLRGKKVLVVDDSSVIRQVMCSHLKAAGFVVEQAANGREAVSKHQAWNPDVTVMDQVMPELNGLDAIVEIRQRYPEARFIMLTSTSRTDEVVTAKTLGVVEYLIKPLQLTELMAAIARSLKAK